VNDPTILYPPCGPQPEPPPPGDPDATTDVAFRIVARSSPASSDTATSLPASLTSVRVGDTYYLEVWVSDVGDVIPV